MAPVLWFEITDWKKETDQVSVSNHSIVFYISSVSRKTEYIKSFKSLKYYDNEADIKVNEINMKFNFMLEKIASYNYETFKLFSNYKKSFNYGKDDIIASRSVLSRIMNTPFEINRNKRKWIIKAKIFKENSIYLYYDKDQELNISEQMSKQYDMLKRYFFVKYPIRYNRKVIKAFDEMFGAMFELKLGQQYLCYTTEIPGVISEHQIINKEQLNAAEPIYCDIFEDGEFSEDIINYNPIWWSKAVLSNAKQCILASYDKDNDCIKDIYKFNMDKFEDKTQYENLWSPDAAWNFLNEFLQFVKDSMDRVSSGVKKECIWKFQSFPNDEQFVSCEILIRNQEKGKEPLIPLSLDFISFS